MRKFPNIKIPTWIHTVTVLNKRDGMDSSDHLDTWKKTVLTGCFWAGQQTRVKPERMSTSLEINESASYLLRVPQSEGYHPYREWKDDMDGFTFSPGDYIIRGEVPEEITPDNVQAVVERYRPDAFEVQKFRDNTGGPMPHYRLEGV